jgi:superfamily II DNA/RNA helicase
MLDLIEPLLPPIKLDFVRLDGSIAQKKRQSIVQRFQEDPNCRVILMSNAGSTGLNLQAANTVINVDLPWNPAVLEQRIARAHRMGQRRTVQAFLLVTEDTIEERLLGTLSAKHDLALAALDVDSDVTQVQLESGIDELKRRLERLLGRAPDAPIDASEQLEVEQQTQQIHDRRQRVAEASGELLGAALNLVGQLLNDGSAPDPDRVQQVRAGLDRCVERDESGRSQLRFTLPDDNALQNLAQALAKLLVVK